MSEPSAVLLRRAATRLDELAKDATPGPWSRRRPGACYLDAAAPADENPAFVRNGRVEVIRSAVWEGTGGEFVRARTDRDLDWIAALSPVVAAPLAEWLRDAADRCAESVKVWEAGPQWQGPGDDYLPPPMTPEQIAAAVEHHHRHELAVARALLGDLPDTPEEQPGG